jgi:hypothetical protein
MDKGGGSSSSSKSNRLEEKGMVECAVVDDGRQSWILFFSRLQLFLERVGGF